ncbi:uncharacterized protein DUF4249 [Neolewinella xylanilytica]|uniref:Uncharacterized protein DUF4249 n=1 Tax=Neolewinella xylanilytica TaxID=1514080 RepID=A0A2S6I023_9BACT|nr:DUF4249 family protein [Neolewinella xylanilytica]PPK84125.1 uncharacterized protein DUF4249 [Neolewinella xylanilytica]
MNSGTYRLLFAFLFLQHCVDPVVPEYDYATGFLLVEGSIVAGEGSSNVTIRRSALSFGAYRLDPVGEAQVFSVAEDGAEDTWQNTGNPGEFVPPPGFLPLPGQSYFLRIQLASGEVIESEPELIPPPVPIDDIRVTFEQEAYFSSSRDRFVPAFTLLANFQGPSTQDNFYQFTYRTWSQISICATCYNSVYRNGQCVKTPSSSGVDRYDYSCSEPCWAISNGDAFALVSDELNPDGTFSSVPAARIDFVGSGKLLAELQLRTITRKAHQYFTVLEDLTEGSAGLNAPLPAPLYGNLTDKSELNTPVLGFISGSSVRTRRILWNRDSTDGEPLFLIPPPVYEPVSPAPPSAPCDGPNRTNQEPAGWNA